MDAVLADTTHLTPAELVERWRGSLSEHTLAQWRYANKGPRYIKVGKAVLYRLDDVRAYEDAQARGSDR